MHTLSVRTFRLVFPFVVVVFLLVPETARSQDCLTRVEFIVPFSSKYEEYAIDVDTGSVVLDFTAPVVTEPIPNSNQSVRLGAAPVFKDRPGVEAIQSEAVETRIAPSPQAGEVLRIVDLGTFVPVPYSGGPYKAEASGTSLTRPMMVSK